MQTRDRKGHEERRESDAAAYVPNECHIFSMKTDADMKELMASSSMKDRIDDRAFPEPDRDDRYSDLDLNLYFDDPEREGLESKRELVCMTSALEEFFRFSATRDRRSENSAYSPLPEEEGARKQAEIARQSQYSDDENIAPGKFCSACGSSMCYQNADRCARQRRPEKLRAIVDEL